METIQIFPGQQQEVRGNKIVSETTDMIAIFGKLVIHEIIPPEIKPIIDRFQFR